jgi:aspartyl protease family protein
VSDAFQPKSGLILVKAEVSGPLGPVVALLVLDTGATATTLNPSLLRGLGYRPEESTDRARLTAGVGSATVPRLMINRLTALGRHAIGLRVLAHELPAEAQVDGILGLDFLRDLTLTIDFRSGRITLS